MTEADYGDMHREIPLLLRESVQSDALSTILHVNGVCETAGVVQVADDQAARAGAISFELHSVEKKTICDAAAGEHNVLSAGELTGFVHLIGVGNPHFCEAGEIAFLRHICPLRCLSNGWVIHQLSLEVSAKCAHRGS